MAERRSLMEGVKPPAPPVDPKLEESFVYGQKARGGDASAVPSTTTPTIARSPISTRIRGDFSKALKRASLERQLKGVEPNTLCDILEQALEPWLKANGYLS
jgi:hypothetical protein